MYFSCFRLPLFFLYLSVWFTFFLKYIRKFCRFQILVRELSARTSSSFFWRFLGTKDVILPLFTPCLNSRTLGPLHIVILRYRVKKVGQMKHLLTRYGCPRVKIGKNQSNCTANQEPMGDQCYKCYIWLEALAHGLSNAFYCIFFKKTGEKW